MGHVFLNFILFQMGWLACVMSGATSRPWIGGLVAISVMAVHLLRAPSPDPELKLVLIAMGIGAVWDSLLVWLKWVHYSSGVLIPHTAPYWIVIMWGLFATLLNVSLRWLRGRWVFAALAGAIGGPAAYYGGERLGALEFGNLSMALPALSVGWAILTPVLLSLASRFDGYAPVLTGRPS